MGLIDKSYLVTLNQRVPGSSPGAPTKYLKHLAEYGSDKPSTVYS